MTMGHVSFTRNVGEALRVQRTDDHLRAQRTVNDLVQLRLFTSRQEARGDQKYGALAGHLRDVLHHLSQRLQVGAHLQQGLLYDVPRKRRNVYSEFTGIPRRPPALWIMQNLINRYLPGVDVLVEFVVDNLLGLVVGQIWAILVLSQGRGQRAGMEFE